jgi:low temperature requirement protein LtrA
VTDTEGAGRRVSWVELYSDLIFVFAVGPVAHAIVAEPHWRGIAAAAGLFATLWWTWIGYVVLYNRHGENRAVQRLFVLAGTAPCALAAVEAHRAAEGHVAGFAFALAGARLVLAVAFARLGTGRSDDRPPGRHRVRAVPRVGDEHHRQARYGRRREAWAEPVGATAFADRRGRCRHPLMIS